MLRDIHLPGQNDRETVARITDELYGDLPPADLEATHRTLAEVTSRAFARLTAAG